MRNYGLGREKWWRDHWTAVWENASAADSGNWTLSCGKRETLCSHKRIARNVKLIKVLDGFVFYPWRDASKYHSWAFFRDFFIFLSLKVRVIYILSTKIGMGTALRIQIHTGALRIIHSNFEQWDRTHINLFIIFKNQETIVITMVFHSWRLVVK